MDLLIMLYYMKWRYVVALVIIWTLVPFLTIYSMNFSLSENVSISVNVVDSFVSVNGNYTTITNIYDFTVTVSYGNYTAILYPGQSVTFPYQSSNVILKANGFEEIIKVTKYD
ncbi:MAG: hypothetical protein QXY87_13255 [Saccharolobus sp.]|uniref:hypothetical protein n=1 Tax=Saccharolobus TaxID=2100760 RepID=UPI001F0FF439|nr:hypothetical protein [Saccharolobus shibatae]MCH4816780.1 hypothetical protein [Saccharolobus shibatae]